MKNEHNQSSVHSVHTRIPLIRQIVALLHNAGERELEIILEFVRAVIRK